MEPELLTIAETLTYSTVSVQTTTLLLTAEISVVFGYLVALNYFLRAAALRVRIFAHFCISLFLIYCWFTTAGQFQIFEVFLYHRERSVEAGIIENPPSFIVQNSHAVVAFADGLLNLLHFSVFFGLLYLAFFFNWAKPEGVK